MVGGLLHSVPLPSVKEGPSYMLKHVADASGPGVLLAYLVNQVIPTVQPIVIFLTALAGLTWYGIRFYYWFRYKRNIDD